MTLEKRFEFELDIKYHINFGVEKNMHLKQVYIGLLFALKAILFGIIFLSVKSGFYAYPEKVLFKDFSMMLRRDWGENVKRIYGIFKVQE